MTSQLTSQGNNFTISPLPEANSVTHFGTYGYAVEGVSLSKIVLRDF